MGKLTELCSPIWGLTISATTSTFANNTGSRFNAANAGGGVDSLDVANDPNGPDLRTQIDTEETLKFTFTFSSAASIDLVFIDLAGQSGNSTGGDQAFVDIGGTTTALYTGVTGVGSYNGTRDKWTPPAGTISINSGDMITFSSEDSLRVAEIQFNVPEQTAVPEPSSVLMFGTALVSILMPRKRRR